MRMREFSFVAIASLLAFPLGADQRRGPSSMSQPDHAPLTDSAQLQHQRQAEEALNHLAEDALSLQETATTERPRVLTAASLDELRRTVLRSDDRFEDIHSPLSLCIPTLLNLCLNGRFLVVGLYENQYTSPGVMKPAGAFQITMSAGYFWFLDPLNMEVPVKILNGCFSAPASHWVFAAGLSNFGISIGVKDMLTGIQKNYVNPPGVTFNTIIDQMTPWPCP